MQQLQLGIRYSVSRISHEVTPKEVRPQDVALMVGGWLSGWAGWLAGRLG